MATRTRGRVLELIGQGGSGLLLPARRREARDFSREALRQGIKVARHLRWYVSHHAARR